MTSFFVTSTFRRRLSTAVLLAAPIVLMASVCRDAQAQATAAAADGFQYNGVVYVSYQADEYAQAPQGAAGTAAIRATGANYASVVATQYEQTYTSNTIAMETTSSPGYNPSTNPLSPTDTSVATAIQNLQAQGLTVVMKPQVDSLDGVFRGQFAPTDSSAWFASYTAFLLHYAQLATSNGVGILIIGTELKSLSGAAYRTNWATLIGQLRTSYPNLQLVYGANATSSTDEFTTVSFWNLVDIIGVDGYFPLTAQPDPTVPQLVAAWSSNRYGLNIVSTLKQLQVQYQKPLIFTELGYVSASGTNEAPYASAASGAAYDPTEQANCYEAFLEVFSSQSSWMKGVFWWAWNVSPPGSSDTGYTPQNKPAATTVLSKWYGAINPGFSIALANPILSLPESTGISTTVAVTPIGGQTGSYTFSASGVPPGVSAIFSAPTSSKTQTLQLSAANNVVPGSYSVTIAATADGTSTTASATLGLTITGIAAQTIAFPPTAAQAVGASVVLKATASSGLPVVYTSQTNSICTVSGQTATFIAAGSCTIAADQSGNSSYSAATEVRQTITVNPAPGFTLAASPATLTVNAGSTTSSTITISGSGGFSSNVTLSGSSVPSAITTSFSSNPAAQVSQLTFSAASAASAGTGVYTVTGTSGTLTSSVSLPYTIQVAPTIAVMPAASGLTITAGGSAVDSISITGFNGFSGAVTLAAVITGSPSGAQLLPSIAISPASVNLNATSASAVASLSATTTAPKAAVKQTKQAASMTFPAALLGAFLLAMAGMRKRTALAHGALLLVVGIAICITGCGGGGSASSGNSGSPGTTTGTYTITVTATSGGSSVSAPVTLTVQ